MVDVLLATSKDQLARDGQIDRTLILVSLLDNPKLFNTLLDHGAKPNAKIENGQTALMFAAQFDKRDIVETLLAHGANPKLVDKKGNSASTLALQNGHPDLAKLIDGRAPGAPAAATTPAPAVAAAGANNTRRRPHPEGPPRPRRRTRRPRCRLPTRPAPRASARGSSRTASNPSRCSKRTPARTTTTTATPTTRNSPPAPIPTIPNPTRPIYTKLRLRRVEGEKFPVVFDAYNPKNDHISLTVHEGGRFGGGDGERKVEIKPGERIPGLSFKVAGVRVRKGYEKDTGQPLDLTELSLLNTDTSRKIVLRRGLTASSPDATATLVLKLDGTQIPVRLGQQFSLPGDPQTRFEVIDIRPEQVVLKIVDSKQTVTVDKE